MGVAMPVLQCLKSERRLRGGLTHNCHGTHGRLWKIASIKTIRSRHPCAREFNTVGKVPCCSVCLMRLVECVYFTGGPHACSARVRMDA